MIGTAALPSFAAEAPLRGAFALPGMTEKVTADNVARHARASQVEVRLERNYEHISIEVSDDGKGFDPEQPHTGRLEMVGMRECGHMLGGVVTIDSAPERGTRVQVHIPFQAAPEEP